MGTEFIASSVWSRITKLARRVPGDVAVAYFARGARKLLPLKPGSRLVVDASERAVKSGQTDPAELLYFINRGVAVHSVENLHAKVFVFADTVVLGSMNVSRRSASVLQEAAVGHQRVLPNGWTPRLVRVPAAAHALLNLWGSGGGRRK